MTWEVLTDIMVSALAPVLVTAVILGTVFVMALFRWLDGKHNKSIKNKKTQ